MHSCPQGKYDDALEGRAGCPLWTGPNVSTKFIPWPYLCFVLPLYGISSSSLPLTFSVAFGLGFPDDLHVSSVYLGENHPTMS